MSEPEAPPLLVVTGRVPARLVGIGTVAGFGVTPLSVVGILLLARSASRSAWVSETAVGKTLNTLDSIRDSVGVAAPVVVASVVLLGAGFVCMNGVAGFLGRRSGAVTVLAKGIVWAPAIAAPAAVPWENLAGFRDTPHPWVEVLDKRGVRRTIPAPSEGERLAICETLARFLPDLGLPEDERKKPPA